MVLMLCNKHELDLDKALVQMSMNPINCYKIVDTICFILLLDESSVKKLHEKENILATKIFTKENEF